MSGLADTGSGLNLGNLEYHQSVAERHPNLVLKFDYLKDMEDTDTFNISGLYGGKENEQVNGWVDVNAVITYKTPFLVNVKPVTSSLAPGEGVACSTIFSWPLLQTIKASIMTENNALVSGLLVKKFRMEIFFPKRSKEASKTSEGIPVSFQFAIQGKKREHEGQRQ